MAQIALTPLTSKELSLEFENLLRKGMLSDIAPIEPKDLYILGATENGFPVGIVTAFLQPQYQIAELQHFGISGDFSLIGKQMLEEIERELAKQEIRMLAATYPSHSPMHAFLKSCKWEGPRIVMLSCYFISHLFAPSWHLRNYALPKGFGFFPWQELTRKDKQRIQEIWSKGDLSPDVYPFYEETAFLSNSLGLRYEGRIVGWSLAESKALQSLEYSKLYIDPAFRMSGIGIQLLSASIQRHDHVRYPNVYFKLNLVQSSLRWLRFVKRRLVPHANSVTEYYQMWHKLQ